MQAFMEIMVMTFAIGTLVYAAVSVVFAIADFIWTFFEDDEDHRLATSNRLAEIDRLRRNEVARYGEPKDAYPGGYYPPVPYSQADVAVWYIQHNRRGWTTGPQYRITHLIIGSGTPSNDDLRELGW